MEQIGNEQMARQMTYKKRYDHFDDTKLVGDLIIALALCHNVTPLVDENGDRVLEASSPDEVALVGIAEKFGLTLQSRTQSSIHLLAPTGKLYKYKILRDFPFKSETKRMGIVVQNEKTGLITFYLKGADTVMIKKVKLDQEAFIIESTSELAK